jgi:uncharacterized protein YidB (DUF937 family)
MSPLMIALGACSQENCASESKHALGSETLARHTVLSHSELLASFSEHQTELIDRLTPQGPLPTEQDVPGWFDCATRGECAIADGRLCSAR